MAPMAPMAMEAAALREAGKTPHHRIALVALGHCPSCFSPFIYGLTPMEFCGAG